MDQTNFYRATHVEVFLPPSDVVGTYANVADVPCEIQICSMMAHVWNEVDTTLGTSQCRAASRSRSAISSQCSGNR